MESTIANISYKKIVPFFVEGDALDTERGDFVIEENAGEFIQKCEDLGIKSFFVRKKVFSNEDFLIDSPNIFSKEDEENINITVYDQSISEFRQYYGVVCAISITVSINSMFVVKVIKEPWYEIFENRKNSINEKLENEQAELLNQLDLETEREQEEYDKKKELLIAEMWKLISISEFCKIPTQKAKLEFALEEIEGLELVEYDELKKEMQQINARIVARGLNKR